VATPIPLFISFEMSTIDTLGWLGFLATVWLWALIAVLWMETVVHVAPEFCRAMKPWASTNEDALSKPFWTVVASGSTVIGSGVIVAVGTVRGYPDVNGDLGLRFGDGGC